MFKKGLLALIILLVLIALYIRLFSPSSEPAQWQFVDNSTPVIPSRIPANKSQTTLRFIPNPLKVNSEGTVEAGVFLSANENQVTEVHYEIGYDPKVFNFVSLKPVDFLGGKTITVNTVDQKSGTIIFGAVVDPAQTPPLTGNDETVELILRPVGNATRSKLTFLPGTTITAVGIQGNALVSAEDAEIQ